MSFELVNADCVDVMSAMALSGDTVDVIITDPPYGIGSWDWMRNCGELAGWHERWCAAALAEGIDFLGVELDPDVAAVARHRIEHHAARSETAA